MKNRYEILDPLRGLASLIVCIAHFGYVLPSIFPIIAEQGKLGVYIFFVISGFIIPFSLHKSNYNINNYFKFMLKRIIRLHPTYTFALVLTFILSLAASYAKHESFIYSNLDIIKSFFYLFVPPENPVFWTLIIEMKYYILIGLIYPFLFSSINLIRILSFLILILCFSTLKTIFSDFIYIPYFLIGILGVYLALNIGNKLQNLFLLLIVLITCIFSIEIEKIIVAFLTLLVIVINPKINSKLLLFLGKISYSLYIIHFVIGVKILNFLTPHFGTPMKIFIFFITLIICIFISYFIYLFIEKPTAKISSNIKYRTHN